MKINILRRINKIDLVCDLEFKSLIMPLCNYAY